ncbi:SDR family oxidoreductase [Luteibacter sp. RCC_6_2]|uniref:SDR family oxidoreductase n=1 Tax=Luteibacter sp. RCC_6_2 TaxID=3239223 RepID=UPI00352445D9
MQKILIIGATSAIAEATARLYAARGAHMHLVARNEVRLKDIAEDLLVRGAGYVGHTPLDINDLAAHENVIEQSCSGLGGLDVVIVAHGTLPDQQACEASVERTLTEFATNASSTLALLTILANLMDATGHGTLAVISSVAGDRGRASNYVYGAAKAAVSTFLSGMRQRFSRTGVSVVTIKPGFVDTPMTAQFRKGRLWAKPEDIARGILWAIDRRRSVVYLPGFWWWIMVVIKAVPEFIFARVKL